MCLICKEKKCIIFFKKGHPKWPESKTTDKMPQNRIRTMDLVDRADVNISEKTRIKRKNTEKLT